MNKGFYDFAHALVGVFYGIFLPGRTFGGENLPETGGYVLCINHISARDPLFVGIRVKRRMSFLAKKELFANRFLARLLGALGAISVDRGKADLAAVRAAMAVVKGGDALGIFPQGTRSRNNTRMPMLSGASMIALRCGVPVLPAYIDGPYRLFRRTDVYFGKPLDFTDLGARLDSATLQAATQRIEDAVWSLKEDTRKMLDD